MDRGHDEVEPREQVVVVVERAVGADLQLAAVEQPEALGRRLGRRRPGRLLGRVAGVELGDDRALLLDPVGRQAAGDGQRLGVVGQDLVGVAAPPGASAMTSMAWCAVRPVGVAVQVAAQVAELDEARQAAGQGRLDLAAVLAQLGLDERAGRGRRTPPSSVAKVRSSAASPVSGSPSSPMRRKPFSDRLQPWSRARSRSRTLCSLEPVKWMRYVPASPGGMTMRSACGPRSSRTAAL